MRLGGGLTPEVLHCIKHLNKFFTTKDDGASFERPGIFCEVVISAHLGVRG
jgi:hypothetical protein